jgi:uncharacterized protein YcfJ
MTKYLAGVLTVIAAGVLLVAYGLLGPRAEAALGADPLQSSLASRPALVESIPAPSPSYARPYVPMQVQTPMPAIVAQPVRAVQTIDVEEAPRQVVRRTVVERSPRRDWKKTALVIGGSSATGAGVGAIFGGKKGALIGAAIGGGASTIFETTRR